MTIELDHLAIVGVLTTYARACDERRWDLLDDVFTDDVTWAMGDDAVSGRASRIASPACARPAWPTLSCTAIPTSRRMAHAPSPAITSRWAWSARSSRTMPAASIPAGRSCAGNTW